MQAVILVGGLGTRLRSSVPDLPKPMADIAGKPFLEYVMRALKENGISNFLFLTGYKSEVIEHYFGNGDLWDVSITYSKEDGPLGTAGALLHAWNHLADEFIVVNGDTFFDVQYDLLIDFARTSGYGAIIALRFTDDVSRYGLVYYDKHFRIVNFLEKGSFPTGQIDGFINGGIYFFRKEVLQNYHTNWQGDTVSIENTLFPDLIRLGQLAGLPLGGRFIDIGIPEAYAEAQTFIPGWLQQARRPAIFLDRDGVLIKDTHYVSGTNVAFLNTGLSEIQEANRLGYLVLVMTNQAGIAKGYFDEPAMLETHKHIVTYCLKHNLKIDSFYYCPYHPQGTVVNYRKMSYCRKPWPGMFMKAAEAYRIDFKSSYMVGDNPEVDRIQLPYLDCRIVTPI